MINNFKAGDLIRYKDVIRQSWHYGFVEKIYKVEKRGFEENELLILRTDEGDKRYISHIDPEMFQLASRPTN
jgi:hypothetical protein